MGVEGRASCANTAPAAQASVNTAAAAAASELGAKGEAEIRHVPAPFNAELYRWAAVNHQDMLMADTLAVNLEQACSLKIQIQAIMSASEQGGGRGGEGLQALEKVERDARDNIQKLEDSWTELKRTLAFERLVGEPDAHHAGRHESHGAVTLLDLQNALRFTVETMSENGHFLFGGGKGGGGDGEEVGGELRAAMCVKLRSKFEAGDVEIASTISHVLSAPWAGKMLGTMLKEYRCVCRWLDLQEHLGVLPPHATVLVKGRVTSWSDLREIVAGVYV